MKKPHSRIYGFNHFHYKRSISVSTCVIFFLSTILSPLNARVIADPNAPLKHQPTILRTQNNAILVNIQAPTSGGVSMNEYKEFDTQENGTILNNSRKDTTTSIGGTVSANPWLARGSASLIVNQVNSNNPSMLKGNIEIAGNKADMIIANPSGISVDGISLINVRNSTLTTGNILFDGVNFKGFDIRGGEINIQGKGLDAGNTDFVYLLAYATSLNANIWANELEIVNGSNKIDSNHKITSSATQNNPSYKFSLDSSKLGGMYANKIKIIGTSKGLGINNLGVMKSNSIEISSSGELVNKGDIISSEQKIKSDSVDNSGVINANNDLNIKTQKDIENSGVINTSGKLKLSSDSLKNLSGTIKANVFDIKTKNIHNKSTISQNSPDGLDIKAKNFTSDSNSKVGDFQENKLKALQESTTTSVGTPQSKHEKGIIEADSIRNENGQILSSKVTLNVANKLSNSGKLNVENLFGDPSSIDNFQGSIQVKNDLNIKTDTISNDSGELISLKNIQLQAQNINNDQGKILASNTLNIKSNNLSSQKGKINSSNSLTIKTGNLDNQEGSIEVSNDGSASLSIDASEDINNNAGKITSGGTSDIRATNIENQSGSIQSNKDLFINADGYINSSNKALIASSESSVFIDSKEDLINNDSAISSSMGASIKTKNLTNNKGVINSLKTLQVDSYTLSNVKGIIQTGVDTKKQTLEASKLRLSIKDKLDNQEGSIISGGISEVSAKDILNQKGNIESNKKLTINNEGNLDNVKGKITSSSSSVDLNSKGNINNNEGKILSSNTLNIKSKNLSSQQGKINSNKSLDIKTENLDNQEGYIGVSNDQSGRSSLNINVSKNINNNSGKIVSEGISSIQAVNIENQSGSIQSNKDLSISASGYVNNSNKALIASSESSVFIDVKQNLINSDSTISSVKDISIKSYDLVNDQGVIRSFNNLNVDSYTLSNLKGIIQTGINSQEKLLSTSNLKLNIKDTLNNQEGSIISGGTTQISAKDILNKKGNIESNKKLTINNEGNLGNVKGKITSSSSNIDLNSKGNINNDEGQILASNTLNIKSKNFSSQKGQIKSSKSLDIKTQTLDNQSGYIGVSNSNDGNSNLNIDALKSINNNSGKILSEGSSSIKSANISNLQGIIQSNDSLLLNVKENVDNSNKGLIASVKANLTMDVEGDLNNHDGSLYGKTDISIKVNNLINNQGKINSPNNLRIDAYTLSNIQGIIQAGIDAQKQSIETSKLILNIEDLLNNQEGSIISGGTSKVLAKDIINKKGSIESNKKLIVSTSRNLYNVKGKITSSSSSIDLNSKGNINNNEGSILASNTLNIKSKNLSSQKGQIKASKSLDIKTQTLDNQSGYIGVSSDESGSSNLNIDTSKNINNSFGRILSEGSSSIKAENIENQSGSIQSNKDLSLNVDGSINNSYKAIIASSESSVFINSKQDLINNDSTISGAKDVFIKSYDLLNHQGVISSLNALEIDSYTLSNLKGIIQTGIDAQRQTIKNSKLTLNVEDLLDNQEGSIISGGINKISAKSIINKNGSIESNEDLSISSSNDIDNSNAKIVSRSSLDLNSKKDINNNQGQILASNTLNIKSKNLSSQKGKINSNKSLDIKTENLDNQEGYIIVSNDESGSSKLNIDASKNINNNSGRMLSEGSSNIKAENIENQSGSIQSNKDLSISADGYINNSNKALIISSESNVFIDAKKDLINNGSTISSAMDGMIKTNNLINKQGVINSLNTLQIDSYTLSNVKGIIQAGITQKQNLETSKLTLNVEDLLNNQEGSIISGGTTQISAKDITNQKGNIESNKKLTINNEGNLDNVKGKITSSSSRIDLSSKGSINNNEGSILASNTLNIKSKNLSSQKGQIKSSKSLDIKTGNLNNQEGYIGVSNDQSGSSNLNIDASKNINNKSGKILSEGTSDIKASENVYNESGKIYSNSLLNLHANFLNNNQGLTQSSGNANLYSNIYNANGVISSDKNIYISNRDYVDNSGGLISTSQDLAIYTNSLDNTHTNQSGGIQADQITIDSNTFDNTQGSIVSDAKTSISARSNIYNNEGTISSKGDMDLYTSNDIINTNGNLISSDDLSINADSLSFDGTVHTGGNFYFDVRDSVVYTGGLFVDKDMYLHTDGNFESTSTLATNGLIDISANHFYNSQESVISGSHVDISVDKFINTGSLQLSKATININGNYKFLENIDKFFKNNNKGLFLNSNGEIFAQDLFINADVFLNTKDATILSSKDLQINAPYITNTDNSNILSVGKMDLGHKSYKSEWGKAKYINNLSSTIQSGDNLNIYADILNNKSLTRLKSQEDNGNGGTQDDQAQFDLPGMGDIGGKYDIQTHKKKIHDYIDLSSEESGSIRVPISVDLADIYESMKTDGLSHEEIEKELTKQMIKKDQNAYIVYLHDKDELPGYPSLKLYDSMSADLFSNSMLVEKTNPDKATEVERTIQYTIDKEIVDEETLNKFRASEIVSGGNIVFDTDKMENIMSFIAAQNDIEFKSPDLIHKGFSVEHEIESHSVYSYKPKFFFDLPTKTKEGPTRFNTFKQTALPAMIIAGGKIKGILEDLEGGIISKKDPKNDNDYMGNIRPEFEPQKTNKKAASPFAKLIHQVRVQNLIKDVEGDDFHFGKLESSSNNNHLGIKNLFGFKKLRNSHNVDGVNSNGIGIGERKVSSDNLFIRSGFLGHITKIINPNSQTNIDVFETQNTDLLPSRYRYYDQYPTYAGKYYNKHITNPKNNIFTSNNKKSQSTQHKSNQNQSSKGKSNKANTSSSNNSDLEKLIKDPYSTHNTLSQMYANRYGIISSIMNGYDSSRGSLSYLTKSGEKRPIIAGVPYGQLNLLGSDSLFYARGGLDLDIKGNLDYSGLMKSEQNLRLKVESFKNNAITLQAKDALAIKAKKDIELSAQDIKAGSIFLSGKNIIDETYSEVIGFGDGENFKHYTNVFNSSLVSTKGNIVLEATDNIELNGVDVDSAGGIGLYANNIYLGSIEESGSYEKEISRGYAKGSHVNNITTNLKAKDNIVAIGQNDIVFKGAGLESENNVVLKAKNKLDLLSVTDSKHDLTHTSRKSGFLKSKRKTKHDEILHDNVVGTSINAKNIFLSGDNKVTLESSDIQADGSINVKSKNGDIDVTAKEYAYDEIHSSKKSKLWGLSKSLDVKTIEADKLKGSTLKSNTGDITLDSGKDINIVASDIESGRNVNLKAFDELNVVSSEEFWKKREIHKSSSLNPLNFVLGLGIPGLDVYKETIHDHGDFDTIVKSSNIKAKGNILADTGSTNILGSNLNAGENIFIKADTGAINIENSFGKKDADKLDKSVKVQGPNIFNMAKSIFPKGGSGKLKLELARASYDKDTVSSKSTNAVKSSLKGKNIILSASDDINIKASDLEASNHIVASSEVGNINVVNSIDTTIENAENKHGSASLNLTIQNEYVEAAAALKRLNDSKKQLKNTKKDYKNYKREVKKLKRKINDLQTRYANGEAGIDKEDIEDAKDFLDSMQSQKDYYKSAIVLASTDVATKSVAVVSQMAAASESTLTSGFSVGLSADFNGKKTTTQSQTQTSTSSNLKASNIFLKTNKDAKTHTNIIGSNLEASNNINILTGDLNVLASQENNTYASQTKSIGGSISFSMYGGGGGSAGLNHSRSKEYKTSTMYTNSQIKAGNNINIKSNNASFKGVNLRSDTLNLDIDNDLDIQSLRDTQTSTNKGHSISGGIGFGNGAITSANAGTSSSKGSTLVKQTKLTSITANKINANVKGNTNIKGALFASGSFSEDGTFIDNEQLNLKTNTLTHANLSNTNYSNSNSLGANLNYNINNNKQSNPTKKPQSTSRISNIGINHSNSMGIKASKTLATLGKGNIQISSLEKSDDLSKLNQDVTKINKQLYESNINTKVDASLDTRLLTKDGRKQIELDYLYAKTHGKELTQAGKDVLDNKELNILDFSSQVKKYASDRDLLIAAQQEQSQKDKDGLKGEQGAKGSQKAIQSLSNELSQKDKLSKNANIILYNPDKTPDNTKVSSQNDFNKQLSNAGYHEKTNSIAINIKNTDMTDSSQVIKATLHEQERHTQSQTNKADTLSKTTQTNLAKARGERGSDTWNSFAGTSGYNTKSNTNQSTWNNNNINSQTISSGNKIVNDMKSEEVKPFLPALAIPAAKTIEIIGIATAGAVAVKMSHDAIENNMHSSFDELEQSVDYKKSYIPPPSMEEINNDDALPKLEPVQRKTPVKNGGGLRPRWKDKKGRIYEWDSEKGEYEIYNKQGKHQGSYNPKTKKRGLKKNRKVEK